MGSDSLRALDHFSAYTRGLGVGFLVISDGFSACRRLETYGRACAVAQSARIFFFNILRLFYFWHDADIPLCADEKYFRF